jgi:hypothetical protein
MFQKITAAEVSKIVGRPEVMYYVVNADSTITHYKWDGTQMVPALSASAVAAVGALGFSPAQKLAALAPKPVGFNAFQLVYDILQGNPGYNAGVLDYIQGTGANIVRIMYPGFSTSDYSTYILSGAVTTSLSDASFKPSFIAATDQVFADCAARGLKLHVCNFWAQSAIPGLFGESLVTAYGSTSSQTVQFMLSFADWFAKRYGKHAAMGIYSLGNEWRYDDTGATNATPAQIGAVFTAVANRIKTIDQAHLITSDFEGPVLNVLQNRDTLTQYATRFQVMQAGLDAWGIHLYDDVTNFMGRNNADNSVFKAQTSNDSGYEGAEALCSALRAAAAADGKLFIVGETGIPTTVETDGVYTKKKRLLRALASHSDIVLLWNAQYVNTAAGNQLTWYIQSGQPRANTFAALVALQNGVKPVRVDRGGGVKALAEIKRPDVCITPARGTAASYLTMVSAAPLSTASRYAVMFWARSNAATIAQFESIADFRAGTGGYGFVLVGDPDAGGGKAFYADFRAASASAGSTANVFTPPLQTEWNHYAFIFGLIGSQQVVECYQNGLYWKGYIGTANAFVPIPTSTTLKLGGQSQGGPLSFQDFAILPAATQRDVLAHMDGAISPVSLMHIRALRDGTVADFARVPSTSIALGTGCVVEVI